MGKTHSEITPELQQWIHEQPVYFVATAPLAAEGHVNCSPKGLETFRVLGPRRAAYLDLTGSGAETAAHLRENGRIVVMFCAFTGPPKIVRLHGTARIVTEASPEWPDLRAQFPDIPGARSIIDATITRVSSSCGFGVPRMELQEPRTSLPEWAAKKGPQALQEYREQKNASSIDGLPAFSGM